jgi:hypothetical protein
MKDFRLKIRLLLQGFPDPDDTSSLRKLLEQFGLASRFEPRRLQVPGIRWAEVANKWMEARRNEAIFEFTLVGTTVAMLAAIVAAVRCSGAGRAGTMTERREIELWPCGYSAECSVPWCRRRATTILRLSRRPEATLLTGGRVCGPCA